MNQPPGDPQPLPADRGGAQPPPVTPRFAAPVPGFSPTAPGLSPVPRDRLVPHLVWEGVLGVVVIVLVAAIVTTADGRLLGTVLDRVGYLGLAAAALAFSMRTATPNLAIGSIALLSGGLGTYLGSVQDWGQVAGGVVAVALSAVLGLIIGLLVAGLSVPAWAVTLGAAVMIEALLLGPLPRGIVLRFDQDYPGAVWAMFAAVISIGGGVLWWAVPGLRNRLSASRRADEPGRWGGLNAGLGAVVGLTVSSVLAGLSGVALVEHLRYAQPGAPSALTVGALAAVLLGGVSIFGRRGGVLGTLLAVLVLESLRGLLVVHGAPHWVMNLAIGLAIVLGLGVSRGLEGLAGMMAGTSPGTVMPVGTAAPPPGHAGSPYGPPGHGRPPPPAGAPPPAH